MMAPRIDIIEQMEVCKMVGSMCDFMINTNQQSYQLKNF